MGGRSTKSWQPLRSDEEERRIAQQKHGKCWMIQKLSTDCDAQYYFYLSFLQLDDMIHLSRTCHVWCHWIRSPSSVVHRSGRAVARRKNSSLMPTTRHTDDLKKLISCEWIQWYLYGCKIVPIDPSKEWSQTMSTSSRFLDFFRSKRPPTFFTQLQSLTQIRHLSLGCLHPNEITPGRIITYFQALSPTLRSLELHPSCHSSGQLKFFEPNETVAYLNQFLAEIHHLHKLEELCVSPNDGGHHLFGKLHLGELRSLPNLRTFLCQNKQQSFTWCQHEVDNYPIRDLSQCRRLTNVSFGSFGNDPLGLLNSAGHIRGFIRQRLESRSLLHHLTQATALLTDEDGDGDAPPTLSMEEDELEYLDLSTTWVKSWLWGPLAMNQSQLKTLNPACWTLERDEWILLRNFTNLTSLTIEPVKDSTIDVDDFLDDLKQCTTLESLTLGHLSLAEYQLETILAHLIQLVVLTLSHVVLGYPSPVVPASPVGALAWSVRVDNLLVNFIQ